MRKNLFLVVSSIILMISCTPQVKTAEVNIDTSNLSAEDLLESKFKLKEIIVLDSVAQALCKTDRVNNLLFIDNKLVVSEHGSSGGVKIFDRESGKLLNVINRAGRGPEEYASNKRYLFQSGDSLIIESQDGSLNYYNVNGEFLKKNQAKIAKSMMWEYMVNNNGNFFLSKELVGLYTHKDKDLPYFSVELISKDGETLKGSIERDQNSLKLMIMSIATTFYNFKDDIYLSPLTKNSIYKYNDKDSTFNLQYKLKIDGEDIDNYILDKNIDPLSFVNSTYRLYITAITQDYIVASLSNKSKKQRYNLLIEKHSSNHYLTSDSDNIDINLGRLIRNSEGYLIQLIDYEDYATCENVEESKLFAAIKKKANITENTNAVLCIYEER